MSRRSKESLRPLSDEECEQLQHLARCGSEPAEDETVTWSVMTLRWVLREAPDGLPQVSGYTIHTVGVMLPFSILRYATGPLICGKDSTW